MFYIVTHKLVWVEPTFLSVQLVWTEYHQTLSDSISGYLYTSLVVRAKQLRVHS